jgi:hypothetical protein
MVFVAKAFFFIVLELSAFVQAPAGKRSDIDSEDLIQSVPDPRSLGVCIMRRRG